MTDVVKNGNIVTPMLFPYAPEEFWTTMRTLIREEIHRNISQPPERVSLETPGLTEKPLYKIAEVCAIFQVSRPTIYDWVKHGKLKPVKIRSRVFFLSQDVLALMRTE